MTKNRPRHLNEVISTFAPEGANDARWFMVDHLLIDARMNIQVTLSKLSEIKTVPENDEEKMIAKDCYDIVRGLYLDIHEHYAAFLSYLSDTDVPERIARKEL